MIVFPRLMGLKSSLAVLMLATIGCSHLPSGTPPSATSSTSVQAAGTAPATSTPHDEIMDKLIEAQVVYLGETHTSVADHAAQLDIIQALHQTHGTVAIAMEMFQRPFQPVLDQYLSGDLSEAELITNSEYETRWGYPWELYAPIIRYAESNQLPLLALNTPAEVTRKVAREGLNSLQGDDLIHIPPVNDIDTSNEAYQAFVAGVFGAHAHGELNFDNFFAAQVLWDETMAENVSQFVTDNPDIPVVVLAGEGHIIYDFGIPSRVERRLGDSLVHYSVLLNPSEELLSEGEGAISDFFWFTP